MSQAFFIAQVLEKADRVFTLFPIFITLMSRAYHKNRYAKSSPSIRGRVWIEISHGTVLGNGGGVTAGTNAGVRLHNKGCEIAGNVLPARLGAH
jgi:hypothetical protein